MTHKSERTSADSDELVEELVAEVADEFIQRMELGEDPCIEEYASRNPAAAAIIRRTLGALKCMRTGQLWDAGLKRTYGKLRCLR